VTVTVSEPAQAALLHDAIGAMQKARDALHLRGFVAFRWKDMALNPAQTDVWALHTGLRREDSSPKPALAALAGAADLWRVEPTAAQTASAVAELEHTAEQAATVQASAELPAQAGVSRRTLRIRRYVSRGRLVVSVDVPPGGGSGRVEISYAAVRGGRIVFRQARRVGTRKRVARIAFLLMPTVLRSRELRISARHGDARATRLLPMNTRRRPESSR
jgi:hypothetical protein